MAFLFSILRSRILAHHVSLPTQSLEYCVSTDRDYQDRQNE